jgi:ATP-dependent DNA helicase RecG
MERVARSSASARVLEKLGLRRSFDLVLHLPLRYEDETKLVRLSDAPSGETVQIEAEVEEAGIKFRPKRMLVCRVRDGDEILHLRFTMTRGAEFIQHDSILRCPGSTRA